MFFRSIYRITWLHYTYGCATLSAAFVCNNYLANYTYECALLIAVYLCKLYLHNYWVTLHLWVPNLKCSLCLLALPTESLGYATLLGALPSVQPLFVSSTYRITELDYTYECATLKAGHVCKLSLQNFWFTQKLWLHHLKSCHFRKALLGYTKLTSV